MRIRVYFLLVVTVVALWQGLLWTTLLEVLLGVPTWVWSLSMIGLPVLGIGYVLWQTTGSRWERYEQVMLRGTRSRHWR